MRISASAALLFAVAGALVIWAAKPTQPYVIRAMLQSGGDTQAVFSLPAEITFGPDQNIRIEVRSNRAFTALDFTGLKAEGCSVSVGETWRAVEKSGRFQLGYSARVVVVSVDTPGKYSGTFWLQNLQPVY